MSSVIHLLQDYGSIEEAYPPVDPKINPSGHLVLFQLRTPRTKTKEGIELPHAFNEAVQWNTQVAKVLRLGPVAFRNRETLEPWPEGDWAKPGDYVRIPLHGGDRWYALTPKGDKALFAIYRDLDIKGIYTGDPLEQDAFI